MEVNVEKWIAYWEESGIFKFKEDEDKPIFVIDTPPPFTSGELHMGQAFWVSYIDSIARYLRMKGYNVLYPIGWDSQGFPTEMAVEKKYGKEIDREEFYNKCVDLAKKNIHAMKGQMYKLGATFDEDYEYITMSPEYRRKVQLSLLQMYEKKFIYRANHPVLWCKKCNTSIAKEETKEFERKSILNYIYFDVEGGKIEIATTRPEMMHACVAIAVNTTDEKYKNIIGKKAIVPLFGMKVPVISDDSIDKEFGTGAEMVCTYGDKNDVVLFYKHKLDYVQAINEKGLLVNAGKYTGLDSEKAREAIISDLKENNLLFKQEETKQNIKVHDRCGTTIELLSSVQWFIKTKEYSDKIKELSKEIKWFPESAVQSIYDWSDHIDWDWNISRKRIFGTPLPFWYCKNCGNIIPADVKSLPVNPAFEPSKVTKCDKCGFEDIKGETDTCDVWVDSSITPMVIAGWPDNTKLFKKGFPASLRIQGSDILRTWAFYTLLRTWALTGSKPFENIIISGLILGKDGREMHKSYGNGVNPEDILKDYGVDALRLWATLSGSAGKNKTFSYEELNYAKSFTIKLYNSALFTKNSISGIKIDESEAKNMGIFDVWILNRFNQVAKEVMESYDKFDLYSAMNKMTNFYWHEFCDYYIENVKYRINSEEESMHESKMAAAFVLKYVLTNSIKLFAPVIPFISEEINNMFSDKSVFTEKLPKYTEKPSKNDYVINGIVFSSIVPEIDYENAGAILNDIISDVRKAKSTSRIALNKQITAININVPDEYYSAVEYSKAELSGICKASRINIEKGDYSVSIIL